MRDQISDDLRNHIDQRLRYWIKDSFTSYDAMEYRSEAIPAIIHCLFISLTSGLISVEAPDSQAHELFDMYLKRARRSKDRMFRKRQPMG